jgi:hypothetical protein
MKTYRITYNSPKNLFQGELFTKAKSSQEAMSVCFEWLKEQSVWTHLWSIQISIEEVSDARWI